MHRTCLFKPQLQAHNNISRPFSSTPFANQLEKKNRLEKPQYVKEWNLLRECAPYQNLTWEERCTNIKDALSTGEAFVRMRINEGDHTMIEALKKREPLPSHVFSLMKKMQERYHKRNFSTSVNSGSSVLSISITLGQLLEKEDIPYAIGGALAYNVWGIPRATVDVDVNVFVSVFSNQLEKVVNVLRLVGATVSDEVIRIARQSKMLFTSIGHTQIECFFSDGEFYEEAQRTRVKRTIDGKDVYFLSAEAICFFKAMWGRDKDYVDIRRLLVTQKGKVDVNYVRNHLVLEFGENSDTVKQWDKLIEEVSPFISQSQS